MQVHGPNARAPDVYAKAFRKKHPTRSGLPYAWPAVVGQGIAVGCAGFALHHVARSVRETFLSWITRVCGSGRIFALRAACFGLRERFLRCGHSVYVAGGPVCIAGGPVCVAGTPFAIDRVCDQSDATAISPSQRRSIRTRLRLNRCIRTAGSFG